MHPNNLRERKKARTRDALATAAADLFAAKGFDATTTEEIAREADVSPRTFFRYYPTKESIAFPRVEERLQAFRERLSRRRPGESGISTVGRALLSLATIFAEQAEEALAQHQLIQTAPSLLAQERLIDLRWEEVIAEGLLAADDPTSSGSLPREREARILAGTIMGLARSILREWFASQCRLDLVALGTSSLDLISSIDPIPPTGDPRP
mgnify:CR=1 FL=1